MNKYLKNVKLRLGVLTVEVALIFSLVIVIGHFFLPENGLMKHLDGIIDVVLGRVTADTGDYKPSGLWDKQEPTPEEPPVNNDTLAKSVLIDALKEAFDSPECHKPDVLNTITEVEIDKDGNITFFTNNNDHKVQATSCFRRNGNHIIMEIIKNKEGGDTVIPGRYEITIN